jgi:hypothetical protein
MPPILVLNEPMTGYLRNSYHKAGGRLEDIARNTFLPRAIAVWRIRNMDVELIRQP